MDDFFYFNQPVVTNKWSSRILASFAPVFDESFRISAAGYADRCDRLYLNISADSPATASEYWRPNPDDDSNESDN